MFLMTAGVFVVVIGVALLVAGARPTKRRPRYGPTGGVHTDVPTMEFRGAKPPPKEKK